MASSTQYIALVGRHQSSLYSILMVVKSSPTLQLNPGKSGVSNMLASSILVIREKQDERR